jgi:hypothetical protein
MQLYQRVVDHPFMMWRVVDPYRKMKMTNMLSLIVTRVELNINLTIAKKPMKDLICNETKHSET